MQGFNLLYMDLYGPTIYISIGGCWHQEWQNEAIKQVSQAWSS